jgi:methyl-accepting chemotaxis protein
MRAKLFWGFALILALMAIVVATTVVVVGRIDGNTNVVRKRALPLTLAGVEIESAIRQMILGIDASIGAGNMEGLSKAEEANRLLGGELTSARAMLSSDPEGAALVARMEIDTRLFFDLGKELVDYNIRQDWEKIPPLTERYNGLSKSILEDSEALSARGVTNLEGALRDITSLTARSRGINLIIGLFALIVSFVMATLIALSIIRPITSLQGVMEKARQGDLTGRFTVQSTAGDSSPERGAGDEAVKMGHSFNAMMDSLEAIFGLVRQATEEVFGACRTLTILAEELTRGGEDQGRVVEDVSSSMLEMNASIKAVSRSASGNLRSAEDVNASLLQIASSIKEVAGSSDVLASTVAGMAQLIREMVESTHQTADNVADLLSRLERSSASLNQVNSAIRSINEKAESASGLAQRVATRTAGEGAESVRKARAGMEEIRRVVLDSTQVIRALGEKSADIDSIVGVIKDVSDQTNLLSLNASILAAQAGENGKGFAVVAQEINDLSDRVSSSTGEITRLVATILSEIGQALRSMQLGSEKVEEGVVVMKSVETALTLVVEESGRAAEASRAIGEATQGQAAAIGEMTSLEEGIVRRCTEISRAADLQKANCDTVTGTVGNISAMAAQLKRATVEQSQGIRMIGDSMSGTVAAAQEISRAAEEEGQQSGLIIEAMEKTTAVTGRTKEVAARLASVVSTLNGHSDSLIKAMRRFTLSG